MSLAIPRPVAVFFDWDGTLVNSFSLIVESVNHVQRSFGHLDFPPDEVREAMRLGPALAIFQHLYGDRCQEALEVYYTYMNRERAGRLEIAPGADEILNFLAECDLPAAVVSNMRHAPLEADIKGRGWMRFFKTFIGAGEAARDKPHPDPLLLAIKRSGVSALSPAAVWYVGDMDTDMRCANAAGCTGVFLKNSIGRLDNDEAAAPKIVIENLHELRQKITEIL